MTPNELPTSVEELQKLVLSLRREVVVTKQQAIELISTVEAQKKRLEQSERTIKELLQALKGKKRERLDPNQLLLFDLGELEKLLEEAATADDVQANDVASSKSPRRRKQKHGRRIIPDNLPTEEIVHELPEEQRLCPIDGKPMSALRYEISEQLDHEPAKLKRIQHKRAVYACAAKHDEATLITAPKPAEAVEKCLAAPGLLAGVVVAKFGDHLPGYRMEDILSRGGVNLNRSTLYWHKACEEDPARAHYVLAIVAKLYKVEDAAKEKSAERQSQREEHSRPMLNDLKTWLDAEVFLPKSLSGKAATYTLNQWAALNRYLEDGDLSIENNASERAMRPVAIGRKNWMFVGSKPAGHRAAILMSLIASCKSNLVEPWAWLKDVLIQLPLGASWSRCCRMLGSCHTLSTAGASLNEENSNGNAVQTNRMLFAGRLLSSQVIAEMELVAEFIQRQKTFGYFET